MSNASTLSMEGAREDNVIEAGFENIRAKINASKEAIALDEKADCEAGTDEVAEGESEQEKEEGKKEEEEEEKKKRMPPQKIAYSVGRLAPPIPEEKLAKLNTVERRAYSQAAPPHDCEDLYGSIVAKSTTDNRQVLPILGPKSSVAPEPERLCSRIMSGFMDHPVMPGLILGLVRARESSKSATNRFSLVPSTMRAGQYYDTLWKALEISAMVARPHRPESMLAGRRMEYLVMPGTEGYERTFRMRVSTWKTAAVELASEMKANGKIFNNNNNNNNNNKAIHTLSLNALLAEIDMLAAAGAKQTRKKLSANQAKNALRLNFSYAQDILEKAVAAWEQCEKATLTTYKEAHEMLQRADRLKPCYAEEGRRKAVVEGGMRILRVSGLPWASQNDFVEKARLASDLVDLVSRYPRTVDALEEAATRIDDVWDDKNSLSFFVRTVIRDKVGIESSKGESNADVAALVSLITGLKGLPICKADSEKDAEDSDEQDEPERPAIGDEAKDWALLVAHVVRHAGIAMSSSANLKFGADTINPGDLADPKAYLLADLLEVAERSVASSALLVAQTHVFYMLRATERALIHMNAEWIPHEIHDELLCFARDPVMAKAIAGGTDMERAIRNHFIPQYVVANLTLTNIEPVPTAPEKQEEEEEEKEEEKEEEIDAKEAEPHETDQETVPQEVLKWSCLHDVYGRPLAFGISAVPRDMVHVMRKTNRRTVFILKSAKGEITPEDSCHPSMDHFDAQRIYPSRFGAEPLPADDIEKRVLGEWSPTHEEARVVFAHAADFYDRVHEKDARPDKIIVDLKKAFNEGVLAYQKQVARAHMDANRQEPSEESVCAE